MQLKFIYVLIGFTFVISCSSHSNSKIDIYSMVIDDVVATPVPPILPEKYILEQIEIDSLLKKPLTILLEKGFITKFDEDMSYFVSEKQETLDETFFVKSNRNFTFYTKIPKNLNEKLRTSEYDAYLKFSKIYFSQNKKQAILFVSVKYEKLSATLEKYFLSKSNGVWIINKNEVLLYS